MLTSIQLAYLYETVSLTYPNSKTTGKIFNTLLHTNTYRKRTLNKHIKKHKTYMKNKKI